MSTSSFPVQHRETVPSWAVTPQLDAIERSPRPSRVSRVNVTSCTSGDPVSTVEILAFTSPPIDGSTCGSSAISPCSQSGYLGVGVGVGVEVGVGVDVVLRLRQSPWARGLGSVIGPSRKGLRLRR